MRVTLSPSAHAIAPSPSRETARRGVRRGEHKVTSTVVRQQAIHRSSCAPAVRRLIAAAVLAGVMVRVLGGDTAQASTQVLAFASSVTQVFDNIRNWLAGILAALATVIFTIGGVRYLGAGGDPGEVEKAKSAFKSAGWGYMLAALAPLVVEILKGIVGA